MAYVTCLHHLKRRGNPESVINYHTEHKVRNRIQPHFTIYTKQNHREISNPKTNSIRHTQNQTRTVALNVNIAHITNHSNFSFECTEWKMFFNLINNIKYTIAINFIPLLGLPKYSHQRLYKHLLQYIAHASMLLKYTITITHCHTGSPQ